MPEVYQDLLAEAAVTDPAAVESGVGRPLKRRRLAKSVVVSPGKQQEHNDLAEPESQAAQSLQIIDASSDSDETDDDLAFEDVDLEGHVASTIDLPQQSKDVGEVTISLAPDNATGKRQAQQRRKPASTAEKAYRLLVHKAHLLCLLGHSMYINSWCNNAAVQSSFEDILDARLKSYLNPKLTHSQFQQDRSFMDGLSEASTLFRGRFEVTASGMRGRPQWPLPGDEAPAKSDVEPMDRADFIAAAQKLQGSQDTGNQLFCAFLRSAGVEARLVCSLQPLPFGSTAGTGSTPQKTTAKTTIMAMASDTDGDVSTAEEDSSLATSATVGNVSSVRRRLGQPSFPPAALSTPPTQKKKAIRKLAYPIFWTEAFNPALQKWIPVDPIVTHTVNKASKLEPPASYQSNQLSYVIALEADGAARDVTRRYAKAFNAKTRRQRVDEGWWRKVMRVFKRKGRMLDREQVEDAELAAREAKEGLPKNVQDFIGHPLYALERHMKRHEVIIGALGDGRVVGRVNAGTAAKPRMERVFRRADVKLAWSAEKWYRAAGRVVREAEIPVKHVASRVVRKDKPDQDEEDLGVKTTPLYTESQTEVYVPPPVVRGRVPRNAFGNLDIYVPSMVPAGGLHSLHPLTQQAAKSLGIDYADAVTGFRFKGRKGEAIVQGAVVAAEHGDAVRSAITGLEEDQVELQSRQRSLRALRLWKRFLTALRIKERIGTYSSEAAELEKEEDEQDAGGFMLVEASGDNLAMPTAGQYTVEELLRKPAKPAKPGKQRQTRRVIREDSDESGEEADKNEEMPHLHDDDLEEDQSHDTVGGFIPPGVNEEDDQAGGFLSIGDGAKDQGGEGGFIVDDIDGEEADRFHSVPEPNGHDEDSAGGFLPDDEHVAETDPLINGTVAEADGHAEHDLVTQTQDTQDGVAPSDEAMMSGALGPLPAASEIVARKAESTDLVKVSCTSASHNREDGTTQMETEVNGNERDPTLDGTDADEQAQQSDRGSMLSRDPDDEDAEPDWLESE